MYRSLFPELLQKYRKGTHDTSAYLGATRATSWVCVCCAFGPGEKGLTEAEIRTAVRGFGVCMCRGVMSGQNVSSCLWITALSFLQNIQPSSAHSPRLSYWHRLPLDDFLTIRLHRFSWGNLRLSANIPKHANVHSHTVVISDQVTVRPLQRAMQGFPECLSENPWTQRNKTGSLQIYHTCTWSMEVISSVCILASCVPVSFRCYLKGQFDTCMSVCVCVSMYLNGHPCVFYPYNFSITHVYIFLLFVYLMSAPHSITCSQIPTWPFSSHLGASHKCSPLLVPPHGMF